MNKAIDFNKLALKSGSSYMISNILLSSLSLITAPLFTRILTTTDYGIASNFASWVSIGLVIVGLGLSYSIGNASVEFPGELNEYIASIQFLGTFFTLIVFSTAILFNNELAHLMNIETSLLYILIIYLFFLPSVIFSQEKFKFQLRYKQNILISLIGALGSIFFCFFFIFLFFNEKRYYGRILGLITPFFLVGFFFYVKIICEGFNRDFTKYWRYALRISIPMVPHSLAMLFLTQMDRIMIAKFRGYSEAGLFSFGFSYAVLLSLLSNAVLQSFQPWVYEKYKADNIISIRTAKTYLSFIMCFVTLALVSIAPEALKLLGSKDFWESNQIVFPIAISSLFQYIYNSYSLFELYHKKTIVIAVGTLIAGLINFTLNMVFIPKIGYIAAAYCTLVSYFALALFHLIMYRKITKKNIYNDKYIWLFVFITAILSYFITKLYGYIVLRYLVILIVIIVIIFFLNYRKKELLDKLQALNNI